MPDDEEYFNFMLPPSIWCKKPSPSRWKMTLKDAAERYPGAEPILSTRETRNPIGPDYTSPPMPGSDAWKKLHGK